ncbi:VirD4-like conjugal transfer protein, CD1115 family [Muriventricola aceti]|uniref:VirD4-like conjugal transfer protein, CD1115 family n=1 Tax=Muriventricola aceti TaxID=2981773 RepID=UPI003EBA353C
MSDKIRKYVLPNLPYLFVFWFFSKIGTAYRIAPGADFGTKLMGMLDTFPKAFETYWPGLGGIDLLVGLAGAAGVYLLIQSKIKQAKKFRRDAEYGTARWGTKEDIKPFVDPKFQNNVILTGTEFLTMNTRPKIPANARNLNACVIGSSGSGKTRFWLTPQLLQAHSSYVVVDPKGGTLDQCGRFLQREKYKVRVFNSIDFSKSMHYNPLAYIKTESDVLKFVTALIANTKGDGKEGDEFWTKAETLLYCALVAYIVFEGPEEERNMNTLVEMINSMAVREDDETFKNAVDYMFDGLERRSPQHFAVRQYKKYKLASGKTLKSILISCGARLAPFDIAELREIMSDDELELDTLGDRKTALFLIMSDTDTTFNFVIAMLQSQLFNLLCDKADDVYGGRLPVHVRCLLDEFANIGQIPNFDKLIATIRSREISASIILQSQSQLKTIYKDAADTIVGNCDTTLFLGGKEKSTLKEISELLGKETIDSFNQSENRGSQVSHGLNYQKLGKELMTQDEIAVMDGGKCILQLRGVRPFFSDKFDITKHPRYKYLADADKKNTFDIERYMKRRPAIVKPDEPFDLYELKATDLQPDNSTERKEM